MAYRLLAGSCDDGPCPTFYVDDKTGDVLVQGYLTGHTPPTGLPDGEGVVRIDKAAWATLLRRLDL